MAGVNNWFHSVWRNHPRWPSTFSECPCGRGGRRGGEPCITCLREELIFGGVVSTEDVDNYLKLVKEIVNLEVKITELMKDKVLS